MTLEMTRKFWGLLFSGFLAAVLFSPALAQQEENPPAQVFTEDEIFQAADSFFNGQNGEGLRGVIAQAFADKGAPEAYLIGEEGSGITEIGYRYGKGTLILKGQGQESVYWKGPSIGFEDIGKTKVFILVFNLYDKKSFYKRFASGESGYFFYQGAAVSYRTRLGMTLAEIRVAVEVSEGLDPAWVKYGPDKLVVPNVLPN